MTLYEKGQWHIKPHRYGDDRCDVIERGPYGIITIAEAVDMDDARMIATAPRMYRLLSHIISCPEAEAEWLDELYEVMALIEGSKNA
jgi:hypothetical protein